MDRRSVLKGLALTTGITVGGLWSMPVHAAASDRRLVVIVLRGGMDGLAAVPPHGDPRYRSLRDDVALPMPGEKDGILDLDGHFGLHPALATLMPMYRAGEFAIVHGVALPYRRRSHFDAQKLLENGSASDPAVRSGWLNRAMAQASGLPEPMAFSPDVPLILRGESAHSSIDPERKDKDQSRLYTLLDRAYAVDPILRDALSRGRLSLAQVVAHRGPVDRKAATGRVIGGLMAAEDGPRVAVLQASGWDTHSQQLSKHNQRFSQLAKTITDLREGLGTAWSRTVVMCVSEFGRTVRANGTGGTDHGTAGAALLLGGAVNGGKVHGDFAGLKSLHEDRDLIPTTDIRGLFKGVLQAHLGLEPASVEGSVFPDSRKATPMIQLIRSMA